jgi:hypothetical protein
MIESHDTPLPPCQTLRALMRNPLIVCSSVCATLLAIGAWTSSFAQSAPWQVVQSSDGTLYVLADGVRYHLVPDVIGDDELAALPDGGVVVGQLLGPPPQPTTAPTPAPVEPLAVLPTSSPQIVVVTATPTLEPVSATPTVSSTPITLPATAVPVGAAEQASTVSGSGVASSQRFSIRGGDYIVSWSFSPVSRSCFAAGASLHAADGSSATTLGSMVADIPVGQSAGGEVRVPNLAAGQYYVTGSTTCNWSVTVRPQ